MALDLRFVGILPAENPFDPGRGVNLLLMVENPGPAVSATVRFYASDGGPWREIFAQKKEFAEKTHIHAYFHLPAECFAPENWGGETPEKLTLWAGETPPGPQEPGLLLFLEP